MSIPLTYKKGYCFLNAYINSRHAYKDLGLKLKLGSLGLNGWFEYGGKNWGKADFFKTHQPGSWTFDAHAWLEDAEGNVYDFCFKHYDWVCEVRGVGKLKIQGLIEGKSKADLEALGLSYVTADAEAQKAMFLEMFKALRNEEAGLANGTARWLEGLDGETAYLAM